MPYLHEFLAVAAIHLLAVMSPGPDFAMISRNSLVYSRRTGLYSALGLALGICVHVTYSLVGIGLVIARSILLFSVLKYLGAAYLIYIGWKSLRARPRSQAEIQELSASRELSPLAAIRTGFLTNVLNPKVTLFLLSIFTQFIQPQTPGGVRLVYGVEMATMTFLWFSFVAVALSHPAVKRRFAAAQHRVEQVFGVLLIGLGLKVAFSASR
jgi:RhtB (resistance to homoserine/threonine) family protein